MLAWAEYHNRHDSDISALTAEVVQSSATPTEVRSGSMAGAAVVEARGLGAKPIEAQAFKLYAYSSFPKLAHHLC